ncbi:hypothetical protein D0Y65_047073 [Glycine soja]|uniref:DUF7271 domain-containing protein n=1 Tax=Glycine soja TaxID=3848 RepID=A0A445FLZ8_GLYSO|nr:hypothetical protein D0Y65_047073 [Glycine soja]
MRPSRFHSTARSSNWLATTRFIAPFRVDRVKIHSHKHPLVNVILNFLKKHTCVDMFLVQNVVKVPLSFHRQWMYRYPNYVLFNCDGTKHFIRVRRYGRRCCFADGLKDFRRAHNVNESVMVRFIASDINTTLSVDVMGPIHRQMHVRSVVSTKRHIFTTDVNDDMI